MKSFLDYELDLAQLKSQLAELENLLASKEELSEKDDLSPFFKNSKDLVAQIGNFHPGIIKPDKYACEYDIFGDFASDFAVGDSRRNSYCCSGLGVTFTMIVNKFRCHRIHVDTEKPSAWISLVS